jgi:hypothetical protein
MNPQPIKGESADPDRREFNRKKFRGKIEIEWGSTTLTGTVRDIGPKGLFVELIPPLWMGATFCARLIVNPILQMNCTVRRVEPGGGMGVSFDLPEEGAWAQLETLLADLSQP